MTKRSLCIMAALLLLPLSAGAQVKEDIELKSMSEVEVAVTTAKGTREVKRIDAAKAKVVPGDVVIFTTEYRNRGDKPAENVVITNPVPEHTTCVDKSVEGKGTTIVFSVDGGKSYAPVDKLSVKDAQGNVRKAGPSDFTHIRWTVTKPVAPGAKGSVSFRAKIK